ncbi:MAG: ABC transporter substrate-binding protein [Porticoccaceae bacterium]
MQKIAALAAKVVFFSLILVPLLGQASEPVTDTEQKIASQFAPLFRTVTQELSENQAMYLENPSAYADFINSRVKSRWDVASTTSALIGKSRFLALSQAEQGSLVAAVDRTLMRYAFEGLEHYTAQIFDVVDVVVNEKGTLGWVQVRMQSPVLMDLNLDLLIKRTDQEQWKAVDVRFKGITYVSIKKHEFRSIIEQDGVAALIQTLNQKNTEFFTALCRQSSKKLKGITPC